MVLGLCMLQWSIDGRWRGCRQLLKLLQDPPLPSQSALAFSSSESEASFHVQELIEHLVGPFPLQCTLAYVQAVVYGEHAAQATGTDPHAGTPWGEIPFVVGTGIGSSSSCSSQVQRILAELWSTGRMVGVGTGQMGLSS